MKEPGSRPKNILKHQESIQCHDLASFMESLKDEVSQNDLKLDLQKESELTASAEISPHHDYYDNKSSSQNQPSYMQLNYYDKLLRFFNSQPRTLMEAYGDGNQLESSGSDLSTNQRFEESGDSRPAENSATNNLSHIVGKGRSSYSDIAPPTLTEAILIKHNNDMEKEMVKKHKQLRCIVRNLNGVNFKKQTNYAREEVNLNTMCGHGVKRSGSGSWEADTLQNHKHQHITDYRTNTQVVSIVMPTLPLNLQNSSRPNDLNNPLILAPELSVNADSARPQPAFRVESSKESGPSGLKVTTYIASYG